MQYFKFSWCVYSFDQECIIKAFNEEKAKEIFIKEVRDKNTPSDKKWAAHYADITNLSEIYLPEYINKKITIHFSE